MLPTTIEALYPATLADIRLDAVRVTRSATATIFGAIIIGGGLLIVIASIRGKFGELSGADFQMVGWVVAGAVAFACWKWFRFFQARRRMGTRQFGSQPKEAALLGVVLAQMQDDFEIPGPNSTRDKREREERLRTYFLESAKDRRRT